MAVTSCLTTATDPREKRAGRTRNRGVLFITQVYYPDPTSVGQHVTDAAEEMHRRGWTVRVITANRGYDNPFRKFLDEEMVNGVHVRRLPFSSFGKKTIWSRLFGQMFFVMQAIFWAYIAPRQELLIVSTSPPFAGLVGVALNWLKGQRFVWWVMDINPDQAVASGATASTSWMVRAFNLLNRHTIRRATQVVTLDPYMKSRLQRKCDVPKAITVLPPWPHDIQPSGPRINVEKFRELHGLSGKFVVMYSGNHALQHPLDTILDAAMRFECEHEYAFVFIGGGAGKVHVTRRIASGQSNLVSLPYQPLEIIGSSLASADLHVVSMGDDMVGIVHPCKIYGALAAGRPVLYLGPEASHAGHLMARHNVGYRVAHGDVDGAERAIRAISSLPAASREVLSANAKRLAAESFSSPRLLDQFCQVLMSAAEPEAA